MKILFLHNNFPAQFKFLLPRLVSLNHEIVFLSIESHGVKIPGVKHFKVSNLTSDSVTLFRKQHKPLGKKIENAEMYRAAFQKLKDSNFCPDITFFHSGWGIGLFLKSIFPSTKSVAYAEWWFMWSSVEAAFDAASPYSPTQSLNEKVSLQYLNSLQATEIAEADFVWSPTKWQKSQFPFAIQKRIEVIHEGVDTTFFNPSKSQFLNWPKLHLTYTSRALEAMRCFDHFVDIISEVLHRNRNVHLTIVGKERAVYRPIKGNSDSLLSIAKSTFNAFGVSDRIAFHERMNFNDYRNLLSNSDVHFYFSRPFVASWSLLEAMSSGAAIVSNPTPMTAEFLSPDGDAIPSLLADCLQHPKAVEDILDLLGDLPRIKRTSTFARQKAETFDSRVQTAKVLKFVGLKHK